MNCPLCGLGETRVLRTVPGTIVSREHFCFSCCARWWSDQCLREGSVIPRDRLGAGYRHATGSSSELSSSLDQRSVSGSDPDPNPGSPENPNRARTREADLGPEVFTFPVIGDPEAPTWAIRATQDAELKAAFPGVDVPGEYRKVLAWLNANRSKRKTARGMMSFLFRWMERNQNKGNGPVRAPVPFAVAAEEGRRERLNDARIKRHLEEEKPKAPQLSPRQEHLRSIAGGGTK